MINIRKNDVLKLEATREAEVQRCGNAAPSLAVRVARNRSELLAAYELTYRRYLAKGYVQARQSEIVYHRSFGLNESRTLIATSDSEGIVGTMTVVGDNPIGLQLDAIYQSEVDQLRAEGRSVAEVTCLSIDSNSIPGRRVFLALTKYLFQHSYLRGYDDLLLAIHPRHYRVYWHAFRAYPIGPCREYASVGGHPALCCRIDLHCLEANMTPKMRKSHFGELHRPEYYDGPRICAADHEKLCRVLAIPSGIPCVNQDETRRVA